MKQVILLFICLLTILDATSQNVGIGTETPQAMLDINGDVVFRTAELPVTDSVIIALDVNQPRFSSYRITQADSAFIIAGITAGTDGRQLTLINQTGHPMTISHADTLALPADQIMTSTHAPVVLEDMGTIDLQYDSTVLKWIVHSTNQAIPEAIWDTTGNNIFFENYVGIGTESPTAPLTIETALDEVGFSHMAGADSITVVSAVSELAGSVGTSTDHIFSLNAGGQGKVHIWPDGDVLIGEESALQGLLAAHQSRMNEFDSKLTVMTPINETGYTHIGGDNEIVVNEAIGGVSASIGTMTNHNFRLKTNGIGRLHVLNDGRVWIGSNTDFPVSQFTVFTPESSYGIAHMASNGILLESHIGLVSASFGTQSNHNFRLVTNGQSRIHIAYDGRVGVGTINPIYLFEVNGTMRAKEIIVETTNWPDYVFAPGHDRLSLPDLERFIIAHRHLPNIPAAADLQQNGIAVGDMQRKMMEKIEELTLYIIEQDKRIRELEKLAHQ